MLSGASDEAVLKDRESDGGFRNYVLCVSSRGRAIYMLILPHHRSIGFSGECLGQHAGNAQRVDLGDGDGSGTSSLETPLYLMLRSFEPVNETAVLRWNYGDPQLGTCTESIIGGNHFRYWEQDGKEANR